MKPQSWDLFLKHIADEYHLRGRLKETFLIRFAYENWRKPDKEIWELAQAASHETYKKQMTSIYGYFSKADITGCPELDAQGKGPGKFNILRDWLKEQKYPEWRQSGVQPLQSGLMPPGLQGAMGQDAYYVEYPTVEVECYREILKPGALIRIKAPEKMGKTSLLRRLLASAEGAGCQTVYLNFREAEGAVFAGLDKFLRWFCANISRELALLPLIEDYWAEELYGSLMSCKTYFQSYLLPRLDTPLLLGLDNVDRVFEYPDIAQDFLPMIRSWHEEANHLEIWQQLRFAIAHATEIYIDIDVNQSPFNVGLSLRLNGFDRGQVQMLAKAHGLDWQVDDKQEQAAALMALVGGHPYLVKLALESIANQGMTFDTLIQQAPTQGGIYGAHLRGLLDRLQRQPELALAMKTVVEEKTVQLTPIQAYKLESMGLVKLSGDQVSPGCELYRQYFRGCLTP
jgi:AAA-like domain